MRKHYCEKHCCRNIFPFAILLRIFFFRDILFLQQMFPRLGVEETLLYFLNWAWANICSHWNFYRSVNYDRPGECSPEKDCLWWHSLTFRQPERKSSSESSLWIVSRCYKSPVVVLIGRRSRDVFGRVSVKPWWYWLWRLGLSNKETFFPVRL